MGKMSLDANESARSQPLSKRTSLAVSSALQYAGQILRFSGRKTASNVVLRSSEKSLALLDNRLGELLPNVPPCQFLGLPVEIRFLIYGYLYESSEVVINRKTSVSDDQISKPRWVNLLMTCKAVHFEAMPIFLEKTKFLITETSFPNPVQDLPRLACRVSHLTIKSGEQIYIDALCAQLVANGCKIPYLTIQGKPVNGGMLCPYLIGDLGACCTDRLTRYFTCYDVEPDLVLKICNEGNQAWYGSITAVIIVFVWDRDDWVCTSLHILGSSRGLVGVFLSKIAGSARERRWLLTADIKITLTGDRPYHSFTAKVVRENEIFEDVDSRVGHGVGISPWYTPRGYRIVTFE